MKRLVLILFCIFFTSVNSYALTSVWTGQTSQDFTDNTNWSNSTPFINSVMVSSTGSQCPIAFPGTDVIFSSGKDFFLGGSSTGEFIMQGGTVNLDDMEIGCDYWTGGGANGNMSLQNGTFTADDTYVGAGNTGELTISGGTFNAGTNLIIGGLGPHAGSAGIGIVTLTAGSLNSGHIDMGEGDSALLTVHSSASINGEKISLRTGGTVEFIIDHSIHNTAPVIFTSDEPADYLIEGVLDLDFYDGTAVGVYDLIEFGTDLSGQDISGLLKDDAESEGWSIQIVSVSGGTSKLQAVYGINCQELKQQGYKVVGDNNGDCIVDINDLSSFADNWLETANPEIEYVGSFSDYGQPLASEEVMYVTPDPDIFVSTPAITVCPNDRIIATFQLSGDENKYNQIPEVAAGGRTYIYTSDDHGNTWQHRANIDILHPRTFVAGSDLFMFGQRGDLRISKSTDWGETWTSYVELTNGEHWNGSGAGVWYKGNNVYLVMERNQYGVSDAWPVAELAPILLRGDTTSDLMQPSNWTLSTAGAFIDYVDDQSINTLFGLPFYPAFYPDRYYFPDAGTRNFSPMGWLETNVVQITDPQHHLYDPDGNTFHMFMRANTGLTNIAAMIKAVEYPDGTIRTRIVKAPSGRDMIFVTLPGGQMRFHILYDQTSELYWLLSTQATDSMTQAKYLPSERFGSPDNERRRLQLHFSKNMFDWCFAGVVAVGPSEKQARSYASMAIDGDDLVILSRSGNQDAESAHNTNMVTFHKIENFRQLIYVNY